MKRAITPLLLLSFFLSTTLTAEVMIKDGYVRGLPPGQPNTAAFMRLVNSGESAVTLMPVSSDAAAKTEFHKHSHSGEMMRMEKVDSITIPAKGEFVLKPGGHHLMLMKLNETLQEGDQVSIALSTASGETIHTTLPVRSVLNEHQPVKNTHGHEHGHNQQHHHH